MGGRTEILQLLVRKDIQGSKVDLGVPVLASLRSSHFDNLAGAAFDHDEAVFAQGRALHGIRRRGAGVGALERVLMLPKWSALALQQTDES